MRRLALAISGLAVILIVAAVATAVVIALTGGGNDVEGYRQEARPLILRWQRNMGLSNFTCLVDDDTLAGQDLSLLPETVRTMADVHRDVQALDTPKRYRAGVEAMGKALAAMQALNDDIDSLIQAGETIALFDPDLALADVPPTQENVSWFVRAQGAFETWVNDFGQWSDFIDCTLPQEPERVGELGDLMRRLQSDMEQINRLRNTGPEQMVRAFAPVLDAFEISTRAFSRLSEAVEQQVTVEQVFADIIASQ